MQNRLDHFNINEFKYLSIAITFSFFCTRFRTMQTRIRSTIATSQMNRRRCQWSGWIARIAIRTTAKRSTVSGVGNGFVLHKVFGMMFVAQLVLSH